MTVEIVPLRSEEDVVQVRRAVRVWAVKLGFGLVDQTKLVTAASELARNALIHGGGGEAWLEAVSGARTGLRMQFRDEGPGIPDLDLALRDGHSTGSGLGLGLGGSRRLMHEFQVESRVGEYTRVTVVRWT